MTDSRDDFVSTFPPLKMELEIQREYETAIKTGLSPLASEGWPAFLAEWVSVQGPGWVDEAWAAFNEIDD